MDSQNFYNRVFVPALEKAGIRGGLVWHSLRHTFASRLAMKGTDLLTLQQLLGHKTLAMVQRYAHLSPSHLKSAVKVLDNWNKPKPE